MGLFEPALRVETVAAPEPSHPHSDADAVADPVSDSRSQFRCRSAVDKTNEHIAVNYNILFSCITFFHHFPPIHHSHFAFAFTVPPDEPRIFDTHGKEITHIAGPFREGQEFFLSCQVNGGKLFICFHCFEIYPLLLQFDNKNKNNTNSSSGSRSRLEQ